LCTKAPVVSKHYDVERVACDDSNAEGGDPVAISPCNPSIKGLMKPDIQALIAQQRAKRNNDSLERQMKHHAEQVKQLRNNAPDALKTIAPEAIKLDLQDLNQLESLLKALEKAERRAIKANREGSIP
jgi:hypothetical protein